MGHPAFVAGTRFGLCAGLRLHCAGAALRPPMNWADGSRGIPLKPKRGLTRISCTRHQATATCAAFIEESRMKFTNANKLHRRSGGMGHPALVAGTRFGLFPGL